MTVNAASSTAAQSNGAFAWITNETSCASCIAIRTSLTREFTILPNAPPTATPIERSNTFPRAIRGFKRSGHLFQAFQLRQGRIAESSGALGPAGSISTGVAIASNSNADANLTFELSNSDGSTAGLPPPVTKTLSEFGNGRFLTEIFPLLCPIQ